MSGPWGSLPWGTAEDELRHRLGVSYDIVRAGLTRTVQATLAARQLYPVTPE